MFVILAFALHCYVSAEEDVCVPLHKNCQVPLMRACDVLSCYFGSPL